jgi:hypothetical protein
MINHKQIIEINNPKMINSKILTKMNHAPFFPPSFLNPSYFLFALVNTHLMFQKNSKNKSSFFVTQTWFLSNASTLTMW